MRRWIALGVVATMSALSFVVSANQQPGEMVVEVEQLEDNLFVLKGGGGNSAGFVTSDGVVVVDTKMAGWGRPLLDAIPARFAGYSALPPERVKPFMQVIYDELP